MNDLAVRLGVHELIAAYVDCIDEDRLEEWPDFFVEQCRYLITSRAKPDYRTASSMPPRAACWSIG